MMPASILRSELLHLNDFRFLFYFVLPWGVAQGRKMPRVWGPECRIGSSE